MKDSEIRKDYFTNNYVIIAPKRNKRPVCVAKDTESVITSCFFCPEQIDPKEVIMKYGGPKGGWNVLVIANKFPALTIENKNAFGKQEVIIETPEHKKEINHLSLEHIEEIIEVYMNRFETLKNIEGIRYVIVFKNEGGKAGASVAHSHSQVIALPLVPPKIKGEYNDYADYAMENDSCPYCDIIKNERGKERVIFEDEHLFVLAPFASNSPYGAWFIPKRHFRLMSEMSIGEKQSFAKAMKRTLDKLDDIGYAYNYFFHNAVNSEDYHMHLKLSPRPNVWAGLELGTGIIINPVPPEEAAKFYRE